MTRKSLADYNCSIARTLDIVGDQWSLLILRDAFVGIETFSGFHESLGISRNILTQRLNTLVDNKMLTRVRPEPTSKRDRYHLSERGRELLPVLIAFMQWGDKWILGSDGEPVKVLDKKNRAPVQNIGVLSRDGRFLDSREVVFAPGPGAKKSR